LKNLKIGLLTFSAVTLQNTLTDNLGYILKIG